MKKDNLSDFIMYKETQGGGDGGHGSGCSILIAALLVLVVLSILKACTG